MKKAFTILGSIFFILNSFSQDFPSPQNLVLDFCYNNEDQCIGPYETYDNIFTFSFDEPDTSSTESELIAYNLYFEESGDIIANFTETSITIVNTIVEGFYYVTAVYDNPQGESLPSNTVESFGLVLNIDNFDLYNEILIYPNPINNNYNLNIESSIEIKKIVLFSLLGKEIFQTTSKIIDFSNLKENLYFIKIITDKGIVTKKILLN